MEKKYCTLVTGACGGLGKAFVKLLAEKKENLILVGTSEKKLDLLLDEFKADFEGLYVKTMVCDLSSKQSREALVEGIRESDLVVNKLINNAGAIVEGDLIRFSNDEIENVIQVNCVGTLQLTRMLFDARDEDRLFEVLTVSSQASFQPMPHMGLYAATKSFLTSVMTALKIEWKDKNVVVTTVCPSGMATNKDMQESINAMGFKGKITTLPAEKVAKIALKALKKKKSIVVPGAVNKLAYFLSKFCSPYFVAKTTGKMWKKSQTKRGF